MSIPLLFIAIALLFLSAALWKISRERSLLRVGGAFIALWAVFSLGFGLPAIQHSFDVSFAPALAIAFLQLAGLQVAAVLAYDVVFRKARIPKVIKEMLMITGYVAALFQLLFRLGVNVAGIFATSAVATAVIGLSLQEMLGNLAGGIVLEIEGGIRPGDYIKCGDHAGWVQHVRIRYTALQTKEGDTVIIPNNQITRSPVVICSQAHRHSVRFTMPYSVNPQDVIEAVQTALRTSPVSGVTDHPAPKCVIHEMEPEAITYQAFVWLTDPANNSETISDVNTRIYFAMKRAGWAMAALSRPIEIRKEQERPPALDPVQALRRTPILRLLSDSDLVELGAAMNFLSFARGEHILRQGDNGYSMYFVVTGQVQILFRSSDGTEREIATLESGNFFGESSLLTGEARSASVLAKTHVDCYRLDKEALQGVIARRPELVEDMSIVMANRQMELSQIREQLDQETARTREAQNQMQFLGRIRKFFGIPSGELPQES